MQMHNFRSKPSTVTALQWHGSNIDGMYNYMRNMGVQRLVEITLGEFADQVETAAGTLLCETPAGTVYAKPGDYVVFASENDYYPVSQELFEQKYEPNVKPKPIEKPVERLTYYGTKRIEAWPLEQNGVEGYGVIYSDGYRSWSPKAAFEEAYQPETAMSFGHAIFAMKEGKRVARAGWNGKGMFLFKVNGSQFTANREPLLSILGEGTLVNYCTHYDMRTADGSIVPWLASQTDIDADDWCIV